MADSDDGTGQSAQDEGQDMATAVHSYAADNITALPVAERRGFTQVDNAYYEGLFGRISPTAYYCLSYLVRNIIGYRHRDSVRLSFKQLGDALGISRNTAMKGLQELEAAHIIGSDGAERGRTQIRSYFFLPIEDWTLSTSAKNEQVQTSPKTALVVSKIGLVESQTSPKIGHLINTKREIKKKEREGANAPTAASAAKPPVSAPSAHTVNPYWDALVALFGYTPATKTERSNWGKVVKELKEAGATPQDIPTRARHYIARYGRERLTINAILKHWTECSVPPPAPSANGRAAHTAPEPVRTLSYEPSDPFAPRTR